MTDTQGATALGTAPVGKLLWQYAVPAIIAMTASSLYNMVDSVFIGQGVGPLAISGLAITFPLMNISTAFGTLVGLGCATLVSVRLGQKDYDSAFKVLGNCVTMNVLLGAILTIVALIYLDPILRFFGGSDATIGYAHEYMEVIILGNIITHLYMGLNAMIRSAGHPKQAMYATIATVVINTILDPVFIYGLDMGIRGAAIATVLSQAISLVWELIFLSRSSGTVHFKRGIFRPQRRIVVDTFSIGLAPFLMNMAACMVVTLINQGLVHHGGDLAVGAYGIVNRLVFVIVMVVVGFNQAMQPIAGFNYGAKQYSRVLEVLKRTIVAATIVTTTGFAVFTLFPTHVVRIFTADSELIGLAAHGLRITVLIFPLVGFQMVTGNFFQSIGKAKKAIVLSLSRQVLVLIPCLFILPRFFGVAGVWYSMPVSDALSTIWAAILLGMQIKQFKKEGI